MPRKKAENVDQLKERAAKNGFACITNKNGKPLLVEKLVSNPSDYELLKAIGFEPPIQPARYYIQVWCEEHVDGAPSEVRGRRLLMTLNSAVVLAMIGKWLAERLGVELPRVQRVVKDAP